MAKGRSPSSRSLEHLRKLGYFAGSVEKVIPYKFIKVDLYNWIDIVAVKAGVPILGVQTTTLSNVPARLAKARGNKALEAWLQAGGQLVVHSWGKRGARGKRKMWNVLERPVTQEDLGCDSMRTA